MNRYFPSCTAVPGPPDVNVTAGTATSVAITFRAQEKDLPGLVGYKVFIRRPADDVENRRMVVHAAEINQQTFRNLGR